MEISERVLWKSAGMGLQSELLFKKIGDIRSFLSVHRGLWFIVRLFSVSKHIFSSGFVCPFSTSWFVYRTVWFNCCCYILSGFVGHSFAFLPFSLILPKSISRSYSCIFDSCKSSRFAKVSSTVVSIVLHWLLLHLTFRVHFFQRNIW